MTGPIRPVDREYILPVRIVLGSEEPISGKQRLAILREVAATIMVHCDFKTPADKAADRAEQKITGSAFVIPGGTTWSAIKRKAQR